MAGLAASLLLAGQAGAVAATGPRPAAGSGAQGQLSGVSCVSAKECVAVGLAISSKEVRTGLAEKWNGKHWSRMSAPEPAGSTGSTLNAVSCATARSCMAVGAHYKPGKTLPEADRWNGSKWTSTTVPAPGAGSDTLDAVACLSATNCWASGSAGDLTLVEHWNGKTWSTTHSPSPNPAKPNLLSGLACASTRECWAVGLTFPASDGGTLTEKWDGGKWAVQTTPSSKAGQLLGDSCASTSACMAVGIGNSLFAIAQRWTGSKWVTTSVPKVSGEKDAELQAVACPARTACVAVGSYYNGTATTLMAQKWNGSSWAAMKVPGPSGTTYASLSGAACTSASNCWAVGYYLGTGSAAFPVIRHWNGTTWSAG